MLQAIRFTVSVISILILPVCFAAAVFLVLAIPFSCGHFDAILVSIVHQVVLSLTGAFEAWAYRRELRSVMPKPLGAALGFVFALAFTFFGTTLASVAAGLAAAQIGPVAAAFSGLLAGCIAYPALSWILLTPRQQGLVRGRKFRTFREVFVVSTLNRAFDRGERIFFGGIGLPWASAVKHWLILGVTGAGKTMVFQLLMQSMLKGRIGPGRDERAILYDNKTELVPLVHALGVPYKIAHPFDKRSVALNLQSMVPTHTLALEIASILMPQADNVGTDPFWINSPRNLLASVMTSFRIGVRENGSETPRSIDWDFRDVVLAMSSQARIFEIITRNPETRSDAEGYFDDPRLLASVISTVKSTFMYYRPIAACWHRAQEKINLTEAVWGKNPYLLVLGNDEEARMAVNAINRVIVTRYGQLALKRPKSATRRIHFILDEFTDLKKLDPDLMAGLLTKGRSKGISVWMGVQSLLAVVHEYGNEVAKTILSQCQNIAILGLGDLDDETADYAARVIGQTEREEHLGSEAREGGIITKRSTRSQLMSRNVVLSSEFSDLPETVRANGLAGWFRTRSIRGYWGTVIPGSFLERELIPPVEDVPAIIERTCGEHELAQWDGADLKRLGLKPLTGQVEEEGLEKRQQKPFRVYRGGRPGAIATGA